MITKLNLSTHPFRNRVLPYVIAGMLLFVSVIGGVYSLSQLSANRKENDDLRAIVQERQGEIDRLKGEGSKVQSLLTPDQRVLLSAAHKLVANKQFGWSRLFADLESVLPPAVSASRISVENVYQDGDRVKAELELGVLAKENDHGSVMAMIEGMQNSGLFQASLRAQNRTQNERVTYTEYTFRVIYAPSYGYSTTPVTDIAQNQGGAQ